MTKTHPEHFKQRRLLNGRRRFVFALIAVLCSLMPIALLQAQDNRERNPEREVRGGLQAAGVSQSTNRVPADDLKFLLDLELSHSLPANLKEGQQKILGEIAKLLLEDNVEEARSQWLHLLASFSKPLTPSLSDLFARHLTHDLLQHVSADLARAIRKVFASIAVAEELESWVDRIRNKMIGLESGKTTKIEIPRIEVLPDGQIVSEYETLSNLTAEQIGSIAAELEVQIKALRDEEPQLRISAQDAIESSEPQIMRLRDVMKMLRDEAKTAIAKP